MALYQHASWDVRVDGCQPGAQLLMAVALGYSEHFTNLGCYNPRAISGSTAPSLHYEGRAIDVGCDALWGPALDAMDAFLGCLISASPNAEIVQRVIFNRRVWTVGGDWHPFTGAAGPHLDHAHIELTREAAENLTIETISDALQEDGMALTADDLAFLFGAERDANGQMCVKFGDGRLVPLASAIGQLSDAINKVAESAG